MERRRLGRGHANSAICAAPKRMAPTPLGPAQRTRFRSAETTVPPGTERPRSSFFKARASRRTPSCKGVKLKANSWAAKPERAPVSLLVRLIIVIRVPTPGRGGASYRKYHGCARLNGGAIQMRREFAPTLVRHQTRGAATEFAKDRKLRMRRLGRFQRNDKDRVAPGVSARRRRA